MADDKPTSPADPMGALMTMAVQMHELAATWQQAGFSRPEAMQLLCTYLTVSLGHGSGN